MFFGGGGNAISVDYPPVCGERVGGLAVAVIVTDDQDDSVVGRGAWYRRRRLCRVDRNDPSHPSPERERSVGQTEGGPDRRDTLPPL